MNILILKSLMAVAIFLVALLGGAVPLFVRLKQQSQAFLAYGDFFARGIFIGAGFIHLLPEALSSISQALPGYEYPLVFTLCAFTVFLVQFIEQGVLKFCHFSQKAVMQWVPFLLMTLLSIHSLIAGAALGLGETLGHAIIIFIAIMAHKGAAAFALGISMRTAKIANNIALRIILLFAVMTPIGIFAGTLFDAYSHAHAHSALLGEGVFNAVAAGTFFYIATFHQKELELDQGLHSSVAEILYFGLGITVMAVVAIWL